MALLPSAPTSPVGAAPARCCSSVGREASSGPAERVRLPEEGHWSSELPPTLFLFSCLPSLDVPLQLSAELEPVNVLAERLQLGSKGDAKGERRRGEAGSRLRGLRRRFVQGCGKGLLVTLGVLGPAVQWCSRDGQ